jgi:hypothetical protein
MPLLTSNNRSSTTIVCIAATLFAAGLTACNLVDDEPPEDPNEQATTDGEAGQAECLEIAEQIQSQCLPPQQFIAMWDEGNSSMILVDDPAASVGIGPGGWLVQVASSADYIGSYHFDGDTCTIGCGWCQPGQSLCHSGFDEDGLPSCMMCVPAETPDPGEQCAQHLQACMGAGDDGLDETGADDDTSSDEGLDETGSDGDTGETQGLLEYDCSQWQPSGAVTLDARGNVIVDAALVEELAVHYGDPLADCDDTSFRHTSTGHFAIVRMATNGLLAQMGLVPNDVILAIDGEPMTDIDTVAATAVDLFLGSRVTSGFTLTIGRGRESIAKAVRVR